jgi:very-short-patch-repair endonuclease
MSTKKGTKRPDVVERNKSQSMRMVVSNTWKNKDNTLRKKKIGISNSISLKGKPSNSKGKHWKLSEEDKMKLRGRTPWNKNLTKNNSEKVRIYSEKSGKTRKERGSQKGEKNAKFGKPDPASRDRIIRTMQSGKMSVNTKPEMKMKEILEKAGIHFERQKRIGRYLADFFISEYNLIIECDGDYWHNRPGAQERDKLRDAEIKAMGYDVIRFWEHEIMKDELDVIGCLAIELP